MYEYKATLDRVVDGDTVDLFVHLGFSVTVHERFRLFGINAPESRTRDLAEKKRGLASKTFLTELLENMTGNLIIRTELDSKGKFGRYLCTLYLDKDEPTEMNINHEIVSVGHAVFREY